MAKISHRVELAANVLIILVGLLLAFALIRNIYSSSKTANAAVKKATNGPVVGSRIDLPDDGFSSHPKTVVLGLDVRCRYCKESAKFYKRLTEEARTAGLKIVAYFPTPVEESQAYVAELGLNDMEIGQIQLSKINVRGTPTMILVDQHGAILDSWVGKIPADKEADVIQRILGVK